MIPHAVRDVADAAAAFSARIGPDRHFDSQEKVEEALAECCSPQNVTVIGMTGSGKSSTLDALAGERFCSRVSSEATLVRWQYRPHPAPHTHEWVLDLFYPSDALLNLEFWDTIGLEQEDAPRKLKHIVPKSDAILVVISARDGNQPPLWDYLRTLEERLHSRMVLVITHAELLSFERLQSLKEELRSTSRERLGVQLPCTLSRPPESMQEKGGSPDGVRAGGAETQPADGQARGTPAAGYGPPAGRTGKGAQ
ncbi:MAG: GTPase [Akkermansia sp.]